MPDHAKSRQTADHFSGCLLGGAVGDALGGPTEFMSMTDIRRRFGPAGQRGYVQLNSLGLAEFTDDTQMTLFTAEGVLLAVNHSGDNDSTGAITGNLLGLLLGKTSIPPKWITSLEMHAEIEQLALRLLTAV